MKLLIASRNRHKLAEIRAIFKAPNLEIIGADDLEGLPDIVEDGLTFQANAVKKAVTLALRARLWTLADDSGLEVEALNGEPGVRSARFAGEQADYRANNEKLLRLLERQANRAARFMCVLALASPEGRAQMVEGVCGGVITESGRGTSGFGYDPLFVPQGYAETFAEMDPELKNRLSHRAQALALAMNTWGAIFNGHTTGWPPRPSRRDRSA